MKKPHEGSSYPEQFGCLPYRVSDEGKVEFLLVTSRDTHQWVFPKGNPMFVGRKSLLPREVVAREAKQEAGVVGKVSRDPIGTVPYDKHIDAEHAERIDISVYLLRVERVLDHWKEQNERTREWISVDEAVSRLRSNTNFPDATELVELMGKAETKILRQIKPGRHKRPFPKPSHKASEVAPS